MRFVEVSVLRRLAPVVCLTALAGCASLPSPVQIARDVAAAIVPGPAASAPATPATPSSTTTAPSTVATPPAAAAAAASAPVPLAPAAPIVVETPVDPRVQAAFDQARRSLRAGRLDDAERAFKALADAHPDLGGPHANLGLIHRQNGKLAESVAAFEQAVKASPRQPVYFNQLGIAYRHNGQFAKAREAYERAMDLDANYAPAILNLGILSDLYLRDNQRALEMYSRYLVLAPGGDATVTKWVAEIKNRKPDQVVVSRKERE